jgi:catechol 2,3-dioxygenase-like lactoylglutathione lyase family enzyme
MKRMHIHVAVDDIPRSVRFYSVMFAAQPSVIKDDYAKWMLEDPRVNFAISTHGAKRGLDHLSIQVDSESELHEVYERLQNADAPVLEEGETTCCYAQSEKSWIADPQGISWETFLTKGESTTYGNSRASEPVRVANSTSESCCAPSIKPAAANACCVPAE